MRGYVRHRFLTIMSAALIALVMSACNVGNTVFVWEGNVKSDAVLSFGKYGECGKGKILAYLLAAKSEYEQVFGKDVWEMKVSDMPMDEFVKNNVLSQVLQWESMSFLAKEKGLFLSENEKKAVSAAAEELYTALSEEGREKLPVTQEDIEEIYEAYRLSGLVFDFITRDVDTEISDSEAKVITVQYIRIPKSLPDTAAAIHEQLSAGRAFETVAAEYSDLESGESDICRGELAGRFDDGGETEKKVFALSKGEVSEIITADKEYFCIFVSVSDYDSDKTMQNKAVMLKERKRTAFEADYHEFMEQLEYSINDEIWEKITVSDYKEYSLENFYGIAEKYGL